MMKMNAKGGICVWEERSLHLLLLIVCVSCFSGSHVTDGFLVPSPSSSRQRALMELSVSTRQSSSSTKVLSEKLCQLLLAKRQGNNKQTKDALEINSLVDKLISAKVVFDPAECLDGNCLFVSTVVEGPTPLWESLGGFFLSDNNIQGQKYTYTAEEMSVINYAEILGPGTCHRNNNPIVVYASTHHRRSCLAFHLRAYGTYAPSDDTSSSTAKESTNPFSNLLASLASPVSSQGTLLQCPVDFTVKVNRASFRILGQSINVPIAGTGYLRVLYADFRLRIFVSPKSTTDDRWEKSGLVVAQIRADLVRPSFELED